MHCPSSRAEPAAFGFGLLATLLLCCLLPLITPTLLAQTAAEIQGTVRDQQGLPIASAEIVVSAPQLGIESKLTTESDGTYRIVGLSAGTYALTAACQGFTTKVYANLLLTVNRTQRLDITLVVGSLEQRITVSADPPLLETNTSSSGSTILPEQIESMPINGRNYLDLLQLVPGVAINRIVTLNDDNSAPILGERANNAVVLIDGQPIRDEVNGGPAEEFNQDAILEFQVLTSGYKAEFGHGSGGILNVLTKSGSNAWHGSASLFHRNYLLDSSDVPSSEVPFLLRWDNSATVSGPLVKDRVFFFGSAERIRESRRSNFHFPSDFPPSLQKQEEQIDKNGQSYETRAFAKLDEQIRRHQLSQEANLTNTHFTDQGDLPSTRTSQDLRRLMLGFRDTVLFGDQGNPYLLNAYLQFRREPSVRRPAHLEEGLPSTYVNLFSSLTTGALFGDVTQELVGPGFTPLMLDQNYLSSGMNLFKRIGRHDVKFGWELQRTRVDGTEATNIFDLLFATVPDFEQFGLANSGVRTTFTQGGAAADRNRIRLRNAYDGLFVQDDWRISKSIMLNLGLRWDYDSEFPNRVNFSPRLGFSWSPNPKTVLNASWGVFYDHFRSGLARDIPGFGGAEVTVFQDISFPRLFYGNPVASAFAIYAGLCLSPNLTDAQIAATGATCTDLPGQPLYGIDHLNSVVAPSRSPLPPNTIVTVGHVSELTGLTPQQFADAASAAIGQPSGFLYWDSSGNLSVAVFGTPSFRPPITVNPQFRTPNTRSFHFELERELTPNSVIYIDLVNKRIRDVLGVRITNLAFEARLPGNTGATVPGSGNQLINSYGPWYSGGYDAVIAGFRQRGSKRFILEANYTYAHAVDNLLNSSLNSDVQTGLGVRLTAFRGATDSFVGVTPVVTEPVTGQTNAHGPFIASNGNPVPQAGKFYYGPDLDRGPSDLAFTHTFLVHGLLQLPRQSEVSAIFRAQSGFHYSRTFGTNPPDVDGDGIPNFVDFTAGRNHFTAAPYVNMDLRLAKWFRVGEHVKLETLIEFFNLFNRGNPSQIQSVSNAPVPFGTVTQVLPGREGQLGVRIEF